MGSNGIQSSANINGSFILRGCSWQKDLTKSLIPVSDDSALHQSRLIFINARPLSRSLVMVARWAILVSLSWLKLPSLSQDVIGSVNGFLKQGVQVRVLQFTT